MLGLGISKSAQGVKSGIVKLLSSLKRRAEYFENKKDSKSTIKEINTYELLDKATILLTPTATSDARVHSVKTYTGDELITNGGFDTDSGWSKVNSTISGGKGNLDGDGQTALLWQDILTDGKTYKATFTISNYDGSGTARLMNNSASITYYTITGNGTFTTYFRHSDASGNLIFQAKSGAVFSIDNVSVTEADADFDFDRASSATRINSDGLVQDMQSITDPELVLNGDFEELGDDLVTNGDFANNSDWNVSVGDTVIEDGVAKFPTSTNSFLIQSSVVSASVKSYKLMYNVVSTNGNNFRLAGGNSAFGTITLDSATIGTKTAYITSNGTNTALQFNNNAFIGSIDNISVQQVDPNDRWNAGNKWSISGGTANKATDATSNISQTINGISGKLQKVVFTVSNYGGSGGVGASADGSNYTQNEGNGTFTEYITPNSNNLYIRASYSFVGSIDNVSVKEVTFSEDVDLARINYDSNGDNGHILLEPTSTNLFPYSEDFSNSGWTKQSNITPTYNTTETLSPDGTYNATKFVGNGSDGVYKTNISITGVVTRSVYLKSVTGNINVKLKDPNLTITTKTLNVTTEWQRFELSEDNTTPLQGIWIDDIPSSGIYIWGAQLEALPYATSYIPTLTGSTVTRATETLTGSGNSTLISTTQGTIYLESKLGSTTGTKLFTIGGGANNSNPAIAIGYTNQNMYMDIVDSASLISTSGDRVINGINVNDYNKMAIKYTTTNVTVYLNGVQKHTETIDFTPATNVLKTLYAGYGAGSKFEGKVKALAVFNDALSDDELELLTGVTNYGSFGELASANGYTII